MRILKFLAAAFVAALSAGSLHAQRPDTDVQAKAREALEQALTQGATNNAAPAANTAPPAAPAQPTPIVAPAAPAVTTPPPSTTQGGISPDTESKAREQLRQAEESNSAPAPAPTNAEAEREEHLRQLEAARAKQAATTPPPATVEIAPAPAPASTPYNHLSPDAEAKAREAMRQAMEQLNAQQKTATVAAGTQGKHAPPPVTRIQTPETAKSWPEPSPTPGPTPSPATGKSGFEPTVTSAATNPSPPAAMTLKQRQLEDLKNKYKMDQITPQQYFEQKAKILAEPEQ